MPRWDAWLAGLADVLGPLLLTVPPNLGSHQPRDLKETLRLAWRHRNLDVRTIADVTRLMTMSIADLLDDWFSSPQVKGALAVNGVIGTWAGPYEPGTAYVMAHHSIGDVGDGHLGNWGFQEGGMGAVADAIAGAARENGAEIRTGARVQKLLIKDGRAAGVILENGQQITAKVVVTSLHPRTAFLDHVGRQNLPDSFVEDIEHWKTRSGVVKINLALAELPDFTADPGTNLPEHHTGSVEMAPTMPYIERAFQDAREGRPATRPFSNGVIPTAFDTTLCPEGYHIMSLFTQWVPSDWSEEPHTEELQAYADRMIDCYNEVAPNFKSSILHADIVGPYEMEHDYGLVGGNIFHGELSLEQLFHMRPAPGFADYRTPVPGLYYASSATHAGGGVCGIPGMQAARAAIADRRAALRGPSAARAAGDHARREQRSTASPQRALVTAMLEARSVALVGASARPGSLGARMIAEVARSPSRPRTYLVNPRYADIEARPACPAWPSCPNRWTSCCSPSRTPPWRRSWRPRHAPGPFGRNFRFCL